MQNPRKSVSTPMGKGNWLASLLFCLLGGCAAVGPYYVAPELSKAADVPKQWTTRTVEPAAETSGEASSTTPWWTELSDPVLDNLVDQAFQTSPTLEAAVSRVTQSRSLYAQANGAAFPNVDAGAGAQKGKSGSTGSSLGWLSTNASWEIDLFGAVRRGREGAQARAEAQQATLADVRVSLAADVTDAYLSYRACQSSVELSEEDVTSREATEKLTAASVKEGFTAPYQAIRSQASVAEAKTQLASTRAYCERQENLLTRLTGVPRPGLMKMLADKPTGLDRLPAPRHFSVAIPSQALTRRPDILAAERRLAAASADIGLAEADRLPRLSLSGALGYSTSHSSDSGTLSFGTWSFGPSLSLPIFDAGRRQAAVELEKSKYEEALADFKARTRSAIQEVEDALTRYAAAHERTESARLSASQYQSFFDSVNIRYREGASNLLELEDARRTMLSSQLTLLNVQQERLQAWVALNRATGGAARYQPDALAPDQKAELSKAAPAY